MAQAWGVRTLPKVSDISGKLECLVNSFSLFYFDALENKTYIIICIATSKFCTTSISFLCRCSV